MSDCLVEIKMAPVIWRLVESMCCCPWFSGLFPTQQILDLAEQPGLQDPDPDAGL